MNGSCAYCNASADTRDHVPPRVLFAKPLPEDAITVPSCLACNQAFAADDEYIGNGLLMRDDISGWPGIDAAVDKVVRALSRRDAAALAAAYGQTMREVEVRTPTGVYGGKASVFELDNRRLQRFVEHIARGMFYHVYCRSVPDRFRVRAATTIERNRAIAERASALFGGRELHTAWGGAFLYKYAEATDSPDTTVWLFAIYGRAVFGATIIDSEPPATDGNKVGYAP